MANTFSENWIMCLNAIISLLSKKDFLFKFKSKKSLLRDTQLIFHARYYCEFNPSTSLGKKAIVEAETDQHVCNSFTSVKAENKRDEDRISLQIKNH